MTMQGVVTLAEVRAEAQQRTDMVNNNFITTPEWNGYIQKSYEELWGLVIRSWGDYYIAAPAYQFTTTQAEMYPLPGAGTVYASGIATSSRANDVVTTATTASVGVGYLTASSVSWVVNAYGGLTLEDSAGNEFDIASNTGSGLVLVQQLIPAAGVFKILGPSGFLTDSSAEWTTNEWQGDILTDAAGNIFQIASNSRTTLTLVQQAQPSLGAYTVTPPAFFHLYGIELVMAPGNNTQNQSLRRFNMGQRNQYSSALTGSVFGPNVPYYNIFGGNVWLKPIPNAGLVIQVYYAPRCFPVVNDTDLLDGVNGWEEIIVADCCVKALAKQEQDVSVFLQQKNEQVQRMRREAQNRDAANPQTVTDVYAGQWGFGGGFGGGW